MRKADHLDKAEVAELHEYMRFSAKVDLRLEFDLKAQTGVVRTHMADGLHDAGSPVEIKRILRNGNNGNGDAPGCQDIAVTSGTNGEWRATLDEDDSLFGLLNCSACDAKVHIILIPTAETYNLVQGYADQAADAVVFHLPEVSPGEYTIQLRKVYCCGYTSVDFGGNGVLTAEKVNKVVQSRYMSFYEAAFEYAIGLADKSGFYQLARNALYDLDSKTFREFSGGLKCRFTQDTWGRAQEDYQMWRNGEVPCSTKGEPWLIHPDAVPYEARSEDKVQLFRLLEAFCADLSYYEPPPKGMAVPEMMRLHSYFDFRVMVITFYCVDDGGLLSDPSPYGKTFELKSDIGLKAVLCVKEPDDTHSSLRNQSKCRIDFDFEGYIEGYTAKNRGNPVIHGHLLSDGCRWDMVASLDNRDEIAFYSFPLWQDYFSWERDKASRRAAEEEELFDTFLFGVPPSLWR